MIWTIKLSAVGVRGMSYVCPTQGRGLARPELDIGAALTVLDCLGVMSCRVGVSLQGVKEKARAEKRAEKV